LVPDAAFSLIDLGFADVQPSISDMRLVTDKQSRLSELELVADFLSRPSGVDCDSLLILCVVEDENGLPEKRADASPNVD